MDNIGQMRLQLGELAGQKYMGQAKAVEALGGALKQGISEYEKYQIDKALTGDFNTIAESARAKGLDDTTLNSFAAMWNATPDRDNRLKLVAGLQSMTEAKVEKTRKQKLIEENSQKMNAIVNDPKLSPEQKQNALLPFANIPELMDVAKIYINTVYESQKNLPKEPTLEEITSIAFGPWAQGKDVSAEAGKPGESIKKQLKKIDRYTPDLAKSLMEQHPDKYKDINIATGYARKELEKRIRENRLSPEPISVSLGGEATSKGIADEVTEIGTKLKKSYELLKYFNPDYLLIPQDQAAQLQLWLDGANLNIKGDAKKANWWGIMNSLTVEQRHDLFGAVFSGVEQKSSKGVFVDFTDSAENIKYKLNSIAVNAADALKDYEGYYSKNRGVQDAINRYKQYLPGASTYFPDTEEKPKADIPKLKDESPTSSATASKGASGKVQGGAGSGNVKKKTIKVGNEIIEY